MSVRMRDVLMGTLGELRYEPTEKRVRAMVGERAVLDSADAVLVWEPRRVVPAYAVPAADLSGELIPVETESAPAEARILHTGFPFRAHSTPGEALALRVPGEERSVEAFRPEDSELAGYVVLGFGAFDAWYEEDEQILGHPRDPFHRVDIRQSSRRVRIELDGEAVADSSRPRIVFETHLPTRFYLPREDVMAELRPSEKQTRCAYKGLASYWSLEAGGREHEDVAWTYAQPLPDSGELAGMVAFFDERADVIVDSELRAAG